MPPQNKFTREQLIDTALELVSQQGMQALTARSLASALGCSVKPIFGLFRNMEQVQQAVQEAAMSRYNDCLRHDMEQGIYPPYKASGMAYIRFARENRELFKLLFMCDRTGQPTQVERSTIAPLLELIQKNLCISEDRAYLFHMEMWLYVHGIATMIATSFLDWQEEFVSDVLTDAYFGLKSRFQEAQNEGN